MRLISAAELLKLVTSIFSLHALPLRELKDMVAQRVFLHAMAKFGIYTPLIYLLLACASTAQVLDPVEDQCARWHHQCK